MIGREVFSLGADSYNGATYPKVRTDREPRIDHDISERIPAVDISAEYSPLKSAKMDTSLDVWGKPLWVSANIQLSDVGSGKPMITEAFLAKKLRERGKVDEDEVAYIVGKQIGGKMKRYNLFPQAKRIDNTLKGNKVISEAIELLIEMWVFLIPSQCRPNVEFQMRLYYEDEDFPDRPSRFKYSVGFFMIDEEVDPETENQISAAESVFDLCLLFLETIGIENVENSMKWAEIVKAIKMGRVDYTRGYTAQIVRLLQIHNTQGLPEMPRATTSRLTNKLQYQSQMWQEQGRVQGGTVDFFAIGEEIIKAQKDSASPLTSGQWRNGAPKNNEGPSTSSQWKSGASKATVGPSTSGQRKNGPRKANEEPPKSGQEDKGQQKSEGEPKSNQEDAGKGDAGKDDAGKEGLKSFCVNLLPFVGSSRRIIKGCRQIAHGDYQAGAKNVAIGGTQLTVEAYLLPVTGAPQAAVGYGTWVGTATGLIPAAPPPTLLAGAYEYVSFKVWGL